MIAPFPSLSRRPDFVMSQLLPNATIKGNRKKRAVRRKRAEMITSFKIARPLLKQVRELAKKMDRTPSWIYREAVQSWVTFHAAKQKHEGADAN